MSSKSWQSPDAPVDHQSPGIGRRLLAILRGIPLAIVVFGCLFLLLVVRMIERPLCGLRRPVTPSITQFVCRTSFRILGIRYTSRGTPMDQHGIVVANHSSWLDIFALNADQRIYFVSKDEVRGWAGIGWLARATGTVFITRDRRHAASQKTEFEDRLRAGHKLLFFPEGTSTDGRRVLKFNPTLFAALYSDGISETLWVQPVTVIYTAPEGQDPRFYGWWGSADFAPHLVRVLSARPQGAVEVIHHPPAKVADFASRKALAAWAENQVRAPMIERGIVAPQAAESLS